MMRIEQILVIGSAAVERLGAQLVGFESDTVEVGSAMAATTPVSAPLEPLRAWIADHPDEARLGVASYFRALGALALEPRQTRRYARLPFAEAAARMYPSLEGPLYGCALRAARPNEKTLSSKSLDGFYTTFFLEMETGRRHVRLEDLQRWDVSEERAEKAALSMLFYRTYETAPIRLGDDEVQTFRVRDSYDGSRALVLSSLFFQEAASGIMFTVPSPDSVLFVFGPPSDAGAKALLAHSQSQHQALAWPLPGGVFWMREDAPTVWN